jgi:hypothetical protein
MFTVRHNGVCPERWFPQFMEASAVVPTLSKAMGIKFYGILIGMVYVGRQLVGGTR